MLYRVLTAEIEPDEVYITNNFSNPVSRPNLFWKDYEIILGGPLFVSVGDKKNIN